MGASTRRWNVVDAGTDAVRSVQQWAQETSAKNPAVHAARSALRNARHRARLRAYMPPKIEYAERAGGQGTIYYLAPDWTVPIGGVRNVYRHVDVLNDAGIPASVLHHRPGFRCDWFVHTTVVTSAAEVTLGPRDLLVVPESYGPGLHLLPAGVPKVVFNQRALRMFHEIPVSDGGERLVYRTTDNLVGMMVVSESDETLVRYCLPDLAIARVRLAIDPALFHPSAEPAPRRIAYMPRRRSEDQNTVLHMLRCRGALDGWELVPIDGLSEQDSGSVMRTCSIFLSFGEREGFGLPPAEAMASGCFVVGFTGFGGDEFFWPDVSTPVPDGDVLRYARTVEEAFARFDADPVGMRALGETASKRVLARYTLDGLTADLTAFLGRVPGWKAG